MLLPLAVGGCAIRPDAMTQAENDKRAQADYERLTKDYVPLNGPLSLAEAIARALKYNYDSELSRVEQTLQEQQLDLAYATMLPKLAAEVGYTSRSNDNAAKSISEITHQTSLDYSYSTTRDDNTAGLEFSWNLLDVGVGYYQARQQGYRALIAVERRRKTIDNVVKGVQDAFWKAAIAERLLPRLDPLMVQAQQMLEASREGIRRGLQPKAQALQFQQNILQVISQLRHMRSDLTTSKVRLATYINVPISLDLTLELPPDVDVHRPVAVDTTALEQYGLNYRPEIRESAYQEKIERQDVYKEIVKMLPGVSILAGLNYDSNSLLYNHTWADIGLHATYNLVELVEGPPAIAAAKTSVEAAKVRRLALGVAVLTQVNLGYQQFLSAIDDLSMATQIDDVARQLSEVTEGAAEAEAQTQADRVRQALTAMAADYDRGRALGDVYTALADLYIAVGVDLVPPDVDIRNLDELTQKVRIAIRPWEAGELPPITAPPPPTADQNAPPAPPGGDPVTAQPVAAASPATPVPGAVSPGAVSPGTASPGTASPGAAPLIAVAATAAGPTAPGLASADVARPPNAEFVPTATLASATAVEPTDPVPTAAPAIKKPARPRQAVRAPQKPKAAPQAPALAQDTAPVAVSSGKPQG
jgi:outer membrane protein TolC